MKCRNCGGEVNPETMVCEYCDTKYTNYSYNLKQKAKTVKNKYLKWIILIFVIVFIAPIAISTIFQIAFAGVTLTGAFLAFKDQEISEQQSQELLVDRLQKNATDLTGELRECTTDGTATIYYNDKFYDNVQILDSAFIEWMDENGIGSDGMDIMFSTDENRNISDIYIKEPDFVIMYKDNDSYVAFRDDEKIIIFETDIELEIDNWYTGYFHYSDKTFHNAIDSGCYESLGQFYYTCQEKEISTEHCANTNKEVTVYKLLVGNDWYYCSKDTYDTVNVGDDLRDDYTFVLAKPYIYK